MKTRREFLRYGTATVGVAAGAALIPSAVKALGSALPVSEPLVPHLDYWKQKIKSWVGLEKIIINNLKQSESGELDHAYIALNLAIAREAPEIFRLDRMMTAPVDIVDGRVVGSRSLPLKVSYTLQLAQDIKSIQGLDAEAELINLLSYEIAYEYRIWKKRMDRIACIICPYVPAIMVRSIDLDTFQPTIGFKIRYGLLPA